ncbi:hypothetical protein L486_07258 [Kwoniella mangroviensis CBS 10435]|uniref:Uncharacterized protein n=1 Tax=Kwoniella mangroviensis CBS 10435 TaxID=1331196 RepID=A0A1B9II71_9TREE|nr:hypothetical protein L486_07258 [Kwoniella mangroviensis CBS 10435]
MTSETKEQSTGGDTTTSTVLREIPVPMSNRIVREHPNNIWSVTEKNTKETTYYKRTDDLPPWSTSEATDRKTRLAIRQFWGTTNYEDWFGSPVSDPSQL